MTVPRRSTGSSSSSTTPWILVGGLTIVVLVMGAMLNVQSVTTPEQLLGASQPSQQSNTIVSSSTHTVKQQQQQSPAAKMSQNEQTYDKKYWEWQADLNKFGAAYKGDIIRHLIGNSNNDDDPTVVLEFGCSGGYILNSMKAADRQLYGVEINPAARAFAKDTHSGSITEIFERTADLPTDLRPHVIYTTSVLEHVDCPLCELRSLHNVLSDANGLMVVGLKNDGADHAAQSFSKFGKEPNHHIYTWNALLLANLLQSAGFVPCHVIAQFDAWHPPITVANYQRDKYAYCQKGLQAGQAQHVQNLWAVAVKDGPQKDKMCQVYKRRLQQILQCEYLKKK